MLHPGHVTVIAVGCGLVMLCVLLHYEALRLLTRLMARFPRPAQPRMVLEALLGLGLIGWSASFTFVEMQRYWKSPR